MPNVNKIPVSLPVFYEEEMATIEDMTTIIDAEDSSTAFTSVINAILSETGQTFQLGLIRSSERSISVNYYINSYRERVFSKSFSFSNEEITLTVFYLLVPYHSRPYKKTNWIKIGSIAAIILGIIGTLWLRLNERQLNSSI